MVYAEVLSELADQGPALPTAISLTGSEIGSP